MKCANCHLEIKPGTRHGKIEPGSCVTTQSTFPRSSQNQTVPSGVEGAHEGTTAGESEPEKLNNAQKVEGK